MLAKVSESAGQFLQFHCQLFYSSMQQQQQQQQQQRRRSMYSSLASNRSVKSVQAIVYNLQHGTTSLTIKIYISYSEMFYTSFLRSTKTQFGLMKTVMPMPMTIDKIDNRDEVL